MNLYVYLGPTYNNDNIPNFSFENLPVSRKIYIQGIPEKWSFTPFVFGENDFE
jgi:hypothetical protein